VFYIINKLFVHPLVIKITSQLKLIYSLNLRIYKYPFMWLFCSKCFWIDMLNINMIFVSDSYTSRALSHVLFRVTSTRCFARCSVMIRTLSRVNRALFACRCCSFARSRHASGTCVVACCSRASSHVICSWSYVAVRAFRVLLLTWRARCSHVRRSLSSGRMF
jgi:hypothetical protein